MEPAPFVVRLIQGDITRARASLLVVNHFNGLAPTGSEAAMDRALNGAISRRAAAGALGGKFGSTHFLPATTSGVPAVSVLVLGLGEPERFSASRISELGAAIVDAAAVFGFRDAATILHGAGSAGTKPQDAARLLLEGALAALSTVEGASCLKELSIVEFNADRLDEIERGISAARSAPDVHVYFERVEGAAPAEGQTPISVAGYVPQHLRLGISRSGEELKITVISSNAIDSACTGEYPSEVAGNIVKNVEKQVLKEKDPKAQKSALESVGSQLYNAFFADYPTLQLNELLKEAKGKLLVLRLDESTVDLPWEILHHEGGYLSRNHLLARQIEIGVPGRQSSYPPPGENVRVLVIGDPDGSLPGARKEAESLTKWLEKAGAKVKALIGGVTYEAVSRELDVEPYDIVHYAGHATFDPLDPRTGGLQLKGHLLTVDDLSSRHFLPRLFFANACNSAQTGDLLDGKSATINMVTGLLAAGARAFVGSMWKVDDQAAVTFATAFYGSLFGGAKRAPASFGEAVLAGREAVVAEHGENEPAWAGYALYGSPWKGIVDPQYTAELGG